ncbi:hypothetical protein [Nocardioides sp.]|uniref:hypothetical protein n=1 Tax=Nocardioides sp. TaxID=35761 RepID=UPI002ED35B4A
MTDNVHPFHNANARTAAPPIQLADELAIETGSPRTAVRINPAASGTPSATGGQIRNAGASTVTSSSVARSQNKPRTTRPTPILSASADLALGLVGAIGGGALATGLQWLSLSLAGGDYFQYMLGLVPLGFGAAAFWLANGLRSSDPVAVPVARAAQVLAAVAVVGGVLLLLAGLTDEF